MGGTWRAGRGGARPRGAGLVELCRGLGARRLKNTAYAPGLPSTGLAEHRSAHSHPGAAVRTRPAAPG